MYVNCIVHILLQTLDNSSWIKSAHLYMYICVLANIYMYKHILQDSLEKFCIRAINKVISDTVPWPLVTCCLLLISGELMDEYRQARRAKGNFVIHVWFYSSSLFREHPLDVGHVLAICHDSLRPEYLCSCAEHVVILQHTPSKSTCSSSGAPSFRFQGLSLFSVSIQRQARAVRLLNLNYPNYPVIFNTVVEKFETLLKKTINSKLFFIILWIPVLQYTLSHGVKVIANQKKGLGFKSRPTPKHPKIDHILLYNSLPIKIVEFVNFELLNMLYLFCYQNLQDYISAIDVALGQPAMVHLYK